MNPKNPPICELCKHPLMPNDWRAVDLENRKLGCRYCTKLYTDGTRQVYSQIKLKEAFDLVESAANGELKETLDDLTKEPTCSKCGVVVINMYLLSHNNELLKILLCKKCDPKYIDAISENDFHNVNTVRKDL